ncbi:hypothetical protein VB713_18815 [Anabaena cylindrica UHCC 0172]|uniref:hypothetical protein n=1 Tax=Anabaena cylindrica TaxID=1165 RepID=UPI002B1FF5C1|nr:hypothetical protein [Anabaena cylindrica]MEA5553000.1 hypothetical protein [Anabaena cylindrica UHCC 0172]
MQHQSQRITLYAHLTIPKISSVVVYIFAAYLLPFVLSSTRPHLKLQQWQLSVSREFFHLEFEYQDYYYSLFKDGVLKNIVRW